MNKMYLASVCVLVGVAASSSAFAQSNVDITGGTIDNTVIGSKTPSTGAFTSLDINASSASNSSSTIDGFYDSVMSSGTGQAFAANPILAFETSSTSFGAIMELDGNNFSTTTPCRPSAPASGCSAADGLRVTGSSLQPNNNNAPNPMSRAIYITGDGNNPQWYDGLEMTGTNVEDLDIHVQNTATELLLDQGKHTTGIDLEAIYGGNALQVVNTQGSSPVTELAVDGSGNITAAGAVTSEGALTVGSTGTGSQQVNVYAVSSASSFQLSPNGSPVGAGNEIGNPRVSGAIDGVINCENGGSSETWEVAANIVNATYLGGYSRSIVSSGGGAASWSISTGFTSGSGYYSPTITVSNSGGGTLECSGLVTVIRQP